MQSKLVAILIQSCLWGRKFYHLFSRIARFEISLGAFAVMFVLTYWTLVYHRPHGRPLNKPMLLAAIVMFVLATTVRLMASCIVSYNYNYVATGYQLYQDNQGIYHQ